jgi:L-lactate dehydrogenase (cytochrome)
MSGKPFDMLPYTWQIAKRPGWAMRFMADHDAMFFPNIQTPTGPAPATDVRQMLTGAVVTWQDLAWIRQAWPGPILAKGVITGDDALRALDHGCAGVIVSNHGGRQLDSCYPSLRALPEVIRQIKWKTTAIGTRPAIIVDGGIRRGGDILKAICLGADAVLIGRSYAYGLMAEGREGVAKAISILRADLERTLVLLGCPSLAELNASYIDAPKHW